MPYSKVTIPNANLESIFSCSNQPVFAVGPDFKVIYANSHAIKLVGKSNLNSLRCFEMFHENKKQPPSCPWKKPACGVFMDGDCKCKVGKVENSCNFDVVPISDKDGKMTATLHMLEVTTEQVRLTDELTERNKELQLINEIHSTMSQSLNLDEVLTAALQRLIENFDFKASAVYLFSEDGQIEMQAHLGLSKRFILAMRKLPVGTGISGLAAKRKKIVYSEDAQLDIRTNTAVLAREGLRATISIPIIYKENIRGVLTLGSSNARKFDKREVSLLESIADQMALVIENSRLYQKTIILSRTDDLTGLFNSRYFEEILQRQISWAKRKNEPFAILMLDLDNLKTVNDLYGHDSGDLVLRNFSQLLRDNLRESDFFARYGGDEFVILLGDTDEKTAKLVSNKLKRKVASTKFFGFDQKSLITTSIGVAMFPKAASSLVSLVKAADIAMYKAKNTGKNQVTFFEPSLLPEINFNNKKMIKFASGADINSIQTLITAVDLKDKYTRGHSAEVSRLSVFMAQRVGLSSKEIEDLRIASLLHDIGKIGISDNILLKPHKLSESEFAQIRKHPQMGVSILKHSLDFKRFLPIILHHHERWDGKGYPHGLEGEKIPLMARIVAVADAFEAMTSNRPYRKGMSRNKALSQLERFSKAQFDPQLVEVFTSIIKEIEESEANSIFLSS